MPMVSEREFLENAAKAFQVCPICGATEGFQVKGRFLKYTECTNCNSNWTAVTVLDEWRWEHEFRGDGEHWLKLISPWGEVGKYIKDKAFPVEFWTNKDNPAKKYEEYAIAILKAVERLRRVPGEVGKIKIKNKVNVLFFGPSGDLVAEMFPWRKGADATIAVIDYTPVLHGNAEVMEKNDTFCFLTSKLIDDLFQELSLLAQKHGEKFSMTAYAFKENVITEVEENMFHPFNPGIVNVPGEVVHHLLRCGIMKESLPGLFHYTFWDKEK